MHALHVSIVLSTACILLTSPTAPTINVTVEANATRFPAKPPYNTFTILCSASAPDGVTATKTIEWQRRVGSDTEGLNPITANGDTILIENRNLTQAVSTSLLTVTENTPGDYRYRCRVGAPELGIGGIDRDVYPIDVTGMFLFTVLSIAHAIPLATSIVQYIIVK